MANTRVFPLGSFGAGWIGWPTVMLTSGNMALASAPTTTRLDRIGTLRCLEKLKTRLLKNARKNPRSEMCESDPPFFESIGVKKFVLLTRPSRKKCLKKFTPGKNYSLYCISRPRVAAQSNRGKSSACLTICLRLLPAREQIEWRAEDGDHKEPSQSIFVCL